MGIFLETSRFPNLYKLHFVPSPYLTWYIVFDFFRSFSSFYCWKLSSKRVTLTSNEVETSELNVVKNLYSQVH